MAEFEIYSEENHPEKSADVIAKANKAYGFVPNLLGALSEAPAVAQAYMDLASAVGNSSLTLEERHVAWFTINTYHGCDYCMAAHTATAKRQKVADDVIEAARMDESYESPKLQALKTFVLEVLDDRGWVSGDKIDVFLEAGFTKQNVLEIILLIAHKTISNYSNHVVHTPLDERFEPFEWKPASLAAE